MKHSSSNRRSRSRGNGARKNNKMQVFDSNGPDVRIRGTAFQVCEKYLTLAKDAAAIGDTIMAENFLQHAEHYQRIINEWAEADNRTVSSDQREDNKADQSYNNNNESEDDLSLPASIIGNDVHTEGEAKIEKRGVSALENA